MLKIAIATKILNRKILSKSRQGRVARLVMNEERERETQAESQKRETERESAQKKSEKNTEKDRSTNRIRKQQ